jgi:nucleotide-binding universal stress UspA family protein
MADLILVATDGSPCALASEDFALALAREHGWGIRGLYVVDPRYLGGAFVADLAGALGTTVPSNFTGRLREILEARGQAVLDRLGEASAQAHVPFERRMERGHPGGAVCEAASGTCLVALGRVGDTDSWARRLLGSTADLVARHAPVSVLVVPGPVEPPRSILVAYGGGPQSGLALLWAARLARPAALPVTVLTVQPDVEEARRIAAVGAALLETEGVVARVLAGTGHPAEKILAETHEARHGLLIVGSSRHSAFRSWLLGGTPARLMHESPVPVLLCR